jgi:hypothetical protein
MDNIIDLIATDSNASEITDQIKNALYSKASERIEAQRAQVAASIFDESEVEETEE